MPSDLDPDTVRRLVFWLLLTLLLAIVGMGVLIALLAAWRNHDRRQRLVDKGQRLRRGSRARSAPPADPWRESAQRYQDAADESDDDLDDNADGPRDRDRPPAGPDDDPDRSPGSTNQ